MCGKIGMRAAKAAAIATLTMLSAPAWLVATPQSGTQASAGSPAGASVEYVNRQYGFRFSLPEGWRGYSIVVREWTGRSPAGQTQERGPVILIRDPRWTADNPREDIPITIFTLAQWVSIQEGKLIMSAAPFGPRELGRNHNYVFALLPRFDYDALPGVQEVETIVQSHPLRAF